MSILAWIEDQKRLKLLNAPKYVNPASDSSKGLWTRCDKCGVILYIKHLKENQRVCFGCSYHLQMSSQERVENLLDKNTWRPLDETVSPCDPLEFHDQKDYTDRLQEAQERTGLQDAIQTGSGMVDGIPIALGVMDFDFMGGSMGSVVGEKVTRLIEYATQEGLVLVLVSASGGARMQEGVFSLMQMAKISSALQVYQRCAHLLYISLLTSPTTGGVTASFAMLGDIIFAEPKALIAFAGRRVIEQTLCEDLPEDFQTSEYMLHHGLLDLIVPRRFLRQALSESIRLYKNAPFQKTGRIPFGVQNPITFVIEEKIRRQLALGKNPIEETSGNLWARSPESTQTHEQIRENKQGETSNSQKGEFPHTSEIIDDKTNTYNGSRSQKSVKEEMLDETQKVDTTKQKNSMPSQKEKNTDVSHSVSSEQNKNSDFTSLQNKKGSISLSSPKDSMLSPLRRETGEYREILTSFQTMFYLFSKQFAIPYSFNENKDQKELQKEKNTVQKIEMSFQRKSLAQQSPENEENTNIFSKRESLDRKGKPSENLFLHNFMTLSETKNENKMEDQEQMSSPYSHDKANGTKHVQSRNMESVGTGRVQKADPEKNKPFLASPSASIDFFHQSIELAATESVEWRAFYIDQSISQKTGFLEDFVQSFHENVKSNEQTMSQNMLFYRSICRHITSPSQQVA